MRGLRKVGAAVGAALGLLGASVAVAAPAQAADAYAYVVINNRVCQSGWEVHDILINDSTSGFTTTRWDRGDNIVYPRVRLYARNNLQIQFQCEKHHWWGWEPGGFGTRTATIYPTSPNQTFWVG